MQRLRNVIAHDKKNGADIDGLTAMSIGWRTIDTREDAGEITIIISVSCDQFTDR